MRLDNLLLSHDIPAPSLSGARPDAIYFADHSHYLIQATSPEGHRTLSERLPLDHRGGFAWKQLEDADADLALFDSIIAIIEDAGLWVGSGQAV